MSNSSTLSNDALVKAPNFEARTDFGVPTVEPVRDISDARVGILATRWSSHIVDKLIEGALETLAEHGISTQNIRFGRIPGCFELPHAADRFIATGRFEALITLGVVVRGGTPHFEFVAGECARGIQEVSIRRGLPIGFGVLTTDNEQQALDRCTPHNNKGREAAEAVLEMIRFNRALRG